MSDLRELYQEMILDHGKRPRNHGEMPDADGHADGHNPLCGDRVTVFVKTKDGKIDELRFSGSGCAISTASASMMTEVLRGKTPEEAERIFKAFHRLVTGVGDPQAEADLLGKLVVLSGVRQFPIRVKCASLAWHTFRAALDHSDETVSTE